jgi:hypothetical protein
MTKNNPDEAVKNLLLKDKKIERLNNIIEQLEKYAIIMRKHNMFETGTQAYHDIVIRIEELKEGK